LVASAALVGAAMAWAPTASAGNSPDRAVRSGGAAAPAAVPNAEVIYSQNDNDSGVGIVSQDFTDADLDIYDAEAADDFTVPGGTRWVLTGVTVTGVYFNGPGPADYEKLVIYEDAGGMPGAVVFARKWQAHDVVGSFTFTLPHLRLDSGTYWLSLQPVMAFDPNGEWGWETRSVQSGNPAVWRNPGNGFGTGCTDWGNMVGCLGSLGEGPDFMFAIYGRTK
jgi:hypothetical protein